MNTSAMSIEKAKELLTSKCTDTLSLSEIIETLSILAKETCRLGNGLDEKILGEYSYYQGQLNGINIALHLISRLQEE